MLPFESPTRSSRHPRTAHPPVNWVPLGKGIQLRLATLGGSSEISPQRLDATERLLGTGSRLGAARAKSTSARARMPQSRAWSCAPPHVLHETPPWQADAWLPRDRSSRASTAKQDSAQS
jgi:hypothetical protein